MISACSNAAGTSRNRMPARQWPGNFSQRPANFTRPNIDYNSAAEKLGVSAQDLQAALEIKQGSRPDFSSAAEEPGISEEELRAALDFRNQQPGRNNAGGAQ